VETNYNETIAPGIISDATFLTSLKINLCSFSDLMLLHQIDHILTQYIQVVQDRNVATHKSTPAQLQVFFWHLKPNLVLFYKNVFKLVFAFEIDKLHEQPPEMQSCYGSIEYLYVQYSNRSIN
jgi:hypothetical protein